MPVRMAVPKELVSGECRVALDPTMAERFTKLGVEPAELLHVDSTRTNRRDIGLKPGAIEILGTLSWRISF